jgi:hypothetical protein
MTILWELVYAPAIGHPARLSGREEVVRHGTWFLGGCGYFRFFDLKVYGFADPEGAVAEVSAEGLIKATGRIYRQDYVVFLRAAGGWFSEYITGPWSSDFFLDRFKPVGLTTRTPKSFGLRILTNY